VIQFHDPVRRKGEHLARKIAIGPLLGELRQCHSVIVISVLWFESLIAAFIVIPTEQVGLVPGHGNHALRPCAPRAWAWAEGPRQSSCRPSSAGRAGA
jgi:hypothetical protein